MNLQNLGVQEMNAKELTSVDGGDIPYISGEYDGESLLGEATVVMHGAAIWNSVAAGLNWLF